MSNMSYCRFQNTVADLGDCRDNMNESLSTDEEVAARRRLIKLCCSIAIDYGDEVGIEVQRTQTA